MCRFQQLEPQERRSGASHRAAPASSPSTGLLVRALLLLGERSLLQARLPTQRAHPRSPAASNNEGRALRRAQGSETPAATSLLDAPKSPETSAVLYERLLCALLTSL